MYDGIFNLWQQVDWMTTRRVITPSPLKSTGLSAGRQWNQIPSARYAHIHWDND